MIWKKVTSIVAAFILLGSVISGYIWFDTKYAKAADTKTNRINIEVNQLKADIRWYQDQMSYIMSRCGVKEPFKLPDHAFKNYTDYKIKKEELDKELNILMQRK